MGKTAGFDKSTEQLLKDRKDYRKPEDVKWNNIYLILFPETSEAPSPCTFSAFARSDRGL